MYVCVGFGIMMGLIFGTGDGPSEQSEFWFTMFGSVFFYLAVISLRAREYDQYKS